MPSEIETALYDEWVETVTPDGHVGAHFLIEFSIRRSLNSDCGDMIVLVVAPETREYSQRTTATFDCAELGDFRRGEQFDSEFVCLPWGIIGFHSRECGGGKWSFQLNCDTFRIGWSSLWPTVIRDN